MLLYELYLICTHEKAEIKSNEKKKKKGRGGILTPPSTFGETILQENVFALRIFIIFFHLSLTQLFTLFSKDQTYRPRVTQHYIIK